MDLGPTQGEDSLYLWFPYTHICILHGIIYMYYSHHPTYIQVELFLRILAYETLIIRAFYESSLASFRPFLNTILRRTIHEGDASMCYRVATVRKFLNESDFSSNLSSELVNLHDVLNNKLNHVFSK